MTEEEKKQIKEEYQDKSAGQLIVELFRLIMLLLWKILQTGFRIFCKFLLFLFESIQEGCEKLKEWWNDNSTQEKVAEIKAWIKHAWLVFCQWCVIAAKATWKGIKIGAAATWKGLILGTKATIQGIIHLGPTLKYLWQLTVKGVKFFIRWMKRCGRGIKLSHIKRKRAYQRFRQNKGIKGLMIDSSNAVKNGIQIFMEEDQEEATADAITEDDIIEEEFDERVKEDSRARKIGKSIFDKAKEVTDI